MKLYSFGEILFDKFEDMHTLGGAPLNVAAHYRQLGGESAIIAGESPYRHCGNHDERKRCRL